VPLVLVGSLLEIGAPVVAAAPRAAPPVCSLASGLKATMRYSGAGGMQNFYFVIYLNAGHASCSLVGSPGVQPVDGAHHRAVGRALPVARARPYRVGLHADGGAVHDVLSVFDPAAIGCASGPWSGVLVHFTGIRAFFVARPKSGQVTRVCTNRRGAASVGPLEHGAN
jgi:hypothetical protein